MGQTLINGIYLPDEGEVRCYAGLASNWTTLDSVVGGYRAHIANENIHITSAERNKWDNGVSQAYVLRYASVSLTALSTVAFSALDNTDNIKVGDKVLDSEGKLFALTAVDTANSTATLSALLIDLSKDSDLSNYYTKGETDTLLNDKADDTGVVHKSGAETIPGAKTFSTFITSDGSSTGDEYSSNAKTNLWLISKRDTDELSGVLFDSYRQNTAQGTGIHVLGISIKENGIRYEGCRFGWYWDNNLNGYYLDFKPTTQGAYQAVRHNLGSSTDKWDTLNGINPGALSMPNLSAGVDISGYLANAGTTTPSEYTPTVDGWLVLAISADSPAFIRVFSTVGVDATVYSERNELGSTSGGTYVRYAALTVPCRQNDKQNIIIMPSTMGIVKAMFYPCQGNV